MGTIELDTAARIININADFITYGDSASYELSVQLANETEAMWNEPNGIVLLNSMPYSLRFNIGAQYNSLIAPETIINNTNPLHNFFRVEDFIAGNISHVDGIGSNSGYLLIDNLYQGSTTIAHEFGHTLGLVHPSNTNIVGKGVPGIMYPRGTLVNPEFQYDIHATPGGPGGTINPVHRRVKQEDIDNLQIAEHIYSNIFIIGRFSNKYHLKQSKPS